MVREALELLLAEAERPPHLDAEQDLERADERVEPAGNLVQDERDRPKAVDVQLEVGAGRCLLRQCRAQSRTDSNASQQPVRVRKASGRLTMTSIASRARAIGPSGRVEHGVSAL